MNFDCRTNEDCLAAVRGPRLNGKAYGLEQHASVANDSRFVTGDISRCCIADFPIVGVDAHRPERQ